MADSPPRATEPGPPRPRAGSSWCGGGPRLGASRRMSPRRLDSVHGPSGCGRLVVWSGLGRLFRPGSRPRVGVSAHALGSIAATRTPESSTYCPVASTAACYAVPEAIACHCPATQIQIRQQGLQRARLTALLAVTSARHRRARRMILFAVRRLVATWGRGDSAIWRALAPVIRQDSLARARRLAACDSRRFSNSRGNPYERSP